MTNSVSPTGEGNWGPSILGLTIAFLVLVITALFLRIFTRVWIVRNFWWDDAAIILAVLGTTIGAGLDFVEVHYGFGTRESFLSPHYVQEFRKYTYGEWIQTFFTLMWTKVSICLFLMRITKSEKMIRPLQWSVAFLLFSNTILSVMWIMQCQPIHAAWDGRGTCMSRSVKEGIVLAQAVISVVSDFAFAALPIVFLWRVQIDFRTKIGLWMLMCLGVFTGACCLVRTVLNNQAIPLDETYDGIVNWLWRLFEVQIGIIAACIPTLRPLYQWCMRRMRGQNHTLDENIMFPLSHKQDSWVEHGRHLSRSDPSTEIPRDRQADRMTDELVREGILKTDARDVNDDPAHAAASDPPQIKRHHRPAQLQLDSRGNSTLSEEMDRYGIGDRPVQQPWGATLSTP